MSTTRKTNACPALRVLNGTLGAGRWPEHVPNEHGLCIHCNIKLGRTGDRSIPGSNRTRNPWR